MAKRMSLKEVALRAHYFKGATNIVEAAGGTRLEVHTLEGDRRDTISGPCIRYELMTNGGRLKLSVYDGDTMSSFDRPKLASKLTSCNKYSGKWNFHMFLEQQKAPTKIFVDAHLCDLSQSLSLVGARKFERIPSPIEEEDVARIGIETLRDRAAMGELFFINGFNKEEASEWVASRMTDAEGCQPDWLVDSARRSIAGSSDIEAYDTYCRYRANMLSIQELDTAAARAPGR